MLIHILRKTILDPSKLETSDIIKKLRGSVHPRTFDAIVRKVDKELSKLKPSETSNLTWTKMAALFGYGAEQNTRDNVYIWETLSKVFGDDYDGKHIKIALGSILQWRLALREDNWVQWIDNTGAIDSFTDKEITVSNYWIDNDFDLTGVKDYRRTQVQATTLNLDKLAEKFKRV